jgi:hypothetical protein
MTTLADLRTKWEKGLTTLCSSEHSDNITYVKVVLKDKKGKYHGHRYIKMTDSWGVLIDKSGVDADTIIKWSIG